ncbi:hypothetical protein [Desulfogranum japonicum]|uniref:hypothetical protein n=1 Tax=Desulfogranum japonicum TaxID=231447 RepID=UPI000423C2E2|nr:hypothetical protein [Desulfogranum japonicum]
MDILSALYNMASGGINAEALCSVFVAALVFFLALSLKNYLSRLSALRWVLANQRLGIDSTWCRIPTSDAYIDGILRKISIRSLTFELWQPGAGFIGMHEIPILTFIGQPRTILSTKPEGAPLQPLRTLPHD